MHEFINAISSRLSHPGSALRAQTIFDQAMSKGKFRWGKKAKRIAGASIAIALREATKSVSLRDIAVSLQPSSMKFQLIIC
jgi:transcription factor IIIB 90 kDa subunit